MRKYKDENNVNLKVIVIINQILVNMNKKSLVKITVLIIALGGFMLTLGTKEVKAKQLVDNYKLVFHPNTDCCSCREEVGQQCNVELQCCLFDPPLCGPYDWCRLVWGI